MTQPAATPPRASDLAPREEAVAAWFGGVSRGAAPAAGSILHGQARPLTLRHGHPSRALLAPFAAAAALLFALVAPAGAGSEPVAAHPPAVVASSVVVVDDPSVPSLHALDTFEQLAWVGRATDGQEDVGDVR